jgi:hypothetical protein
MAAAVSQYLSAPDGLHAFAKAMFGFSTALAWLVSTFHGLFPLLLIK